MCCIMRHLLPAALLLTACVPQTKGPVSSPNAPGITVVARSPKYPWNGVAVTDDERIFASFPRFDNDDENPSVVRVAPDGTLVPYPGGDWNHWKKGDDPRTRFVSVNALYVDRRSNHLWIVDPAAPQLGRAVANGPKVVEIDLANDAVLRVYPIDAASAPAESYLNDIRIRGNNAFITDSGVGAIIILDRTTGKTRRVLAQSKLTKADPSIVPLIDEHRLVGRDGKPPRINVDQIERSADGYNIFFATPFGPNLYRVATIDLLDESLSDQDLEQRVVLDRAIKPIGGMAMNMSDTLFQSQLETHSIRAESRDKKHIWTLVDHRLVWPDAYSILSDGTLYVVAAQIERLPAFNNGADRRSPPYLMFKIEP